jgi:hypothetical protein
MNILWGAILFIISSIGWIGQMISAFNPGLAARLGLTEAESEVDRTFHIDGHAEAYWDTLILWLLPAAGILLILNNPSWMYFGLIGGGMYLYFAGRGIMVRRKMQQSGIQIGSQDTLKTAYIALSIWGVTAIITIVYAILTYSNSIS